MHDLHKKRALSNRQNGIIIHSLVKRREIYMDKFKEMKLTPVQGELEYAPMVEESPVSIECRVTNVMELGSHDMFMAEVTAVYVDEQYMDEKGTFHLEKAAPLVYSHGQYYGLGRHLGGFGYAVRKKPVKKRKK